MFMLCRLFCYFMWWYTKYLLIRFTYTAKYTNCCVEIVCRGYNVINSFMCANTRKAEWKQYEKPSYKCDTNVRFYCSLSQLSYCLRVEISLRRFFDKTNLFFSTTTRGRMEGFYALSRARPENQTFLLFLPASALLASYQAASIIIISWKYIKCHLSDLENWGRKIKNLSKRLNHKIVIFRKKQPRRSN